MHQIRRTVPYPHALYPARRRQFSRDSRQGWRTAAAARPPRHDPRRCDGPHPPSHPEPNSQPVSQSVSQSSGHSVLTDWARPGWAGLGWVSGVCSLCTIFFSFLFGFGHRREREKRDAGRGLIGWLVRPFGCDGGGGGGCLVGSGLSGLVGRKMGVVQYHHHHSHLFFFYTMCIFLSLFKRHGGNEK